MVVIGQSCLNRAKVDVFCQKWLYSRKVVVFGQNGCIRAKVVVIVKKWLYSSKWVVLRLKGLYSGKSGFFRANRL